MGYRFEAEMQFQNVPELKNGIVTLAEASLMKSCVGLSCGKAIVREDIED
jgi:hypothetical protein